MVSSLEIQIYFLYKYSNCFKICMLMGYLFALFINFYFYLSVPFLNKALLFVHKCAYGSYLETFHLIYEVVTFLLTITLDMIE